MSAATRARESRIGYKIACFAGTSDHLFVLALRKDAWPSIAGHDFGFHGASSATIFPGASLA